MESIEVHPTRKLVENLLLVGPNLSSPDVHGEKSIQHPSPLPVYSILIETAPTGNSLVRKQSQPESNLGI